MSEGGQRGSIRDLAVAILLILEGQSREEEVEDV
jgi:hypothetical protein